MHSDAVAGSSDRCTNELCERASDGISPVLQRCRCGAGFCSEDCWIICWHFGHRTSCPNAGDIIAAVSAAQPLPSVADIPKTGSLRERAERSVLDTASIMAKIALCQDRCEQRDQLPSPIANCCYPAAQLQQQQPNCKQPPSSGEISPVRGNAVTPGSHQQQATPQQLHSTKAASRLDETGHAPTEFIVHSADVLRHPVHAATVDEQEQVDIMDVLVGMGFDQGDAVAALKRTSSMEAAVEFLMMHGTPGRHADLVEPNGELDVTKRLDHAGQVALGQLARPWWSHLGNSHEATAGDTVTALLSLGFSTTQAQSAARRCSSVEAAVEWISKQPAPLD